MELVMKNNIFKREDLYFLQLLWTAMGTSATCIWATIYFTVHGMGKLMHRHRKDLLLMLCFIDNITGT
jgi:hypothetical protein